jgi:hypothetical protein
LKASSFSQAGINGDVSQVRTYLQRRHLALGAVRALKDGLGRDSIVSKRQGERYGRGTGGLPLARGAL